MRPITTLLALLLATAASAQEWTRTYSIATHCPGSPAACNSTRLQADVRAAVATNLVRVDTTDDAMMLVFESEPSEAELTTLDGGDSVSIPEPAGGLVASHDSSPTQNGNRSTAASLATTDADAYTDLLTIDIPAQSGTKVRVWWEVDLGSSEAGTTVKARLYDDTAGAPIACSRAEDTAGGEAVSYTGVKLYTLDNAATTLRLQYRRVAGTGNVTGKGSAIEWKREE